MEEISWHRLRAYSTKPASATTVSAQRITSNAIEEHKRKSSERNNAKDRVNTYARHPDAPKSRCKRCAPHQPTLGPNLPVVSHKTRWQHPPPALRMNGTQPPCAFSRSAGLAKTCSAGTDSTKPPSTSRPQRCTSFNQADSASGSGGHLIPPEEHGATSPALAAEGPGLILRSLRLRVP